MRSGEAEEESGGAAQGVCDGDAVRHGGGGSGNSVLHSIWPADEVGRELRVAFCGLDGGAGDDAGVQRGSRTAVSVCVGGADVFRCVAFFDSDLSNPDCVLASAEFSMEG